MMEHGTSFAQEGVSLSNITLLRKMFIDIKKKLPEKEYNMVVNGRREMDHVISSPGSKLHG